MSNVGAQAMSGERPGFCAERELIRRCTSSVVSSTGRFLLPERCWRSRVMWWKRPSKFWLHKIEPLNNIITSQTCSDTGYYAEVRWSSRGNVLQWVVTLCCEVQVFLSEKQNSHLSLRFPYSKWILKLTYISHTFAEINKLDISIERPWSGID
jgi:hypothetical protein